jgi:hypothetical protein
MNGMEGVLNTKKPASSPEGLSQSESLEMKESVEKAKKLRAQLEEFNNTDVIGADALAEVESIATELSSELENISARICLAEGLPYHPTDKKVV